MPDIKIDEPESNIAVRDNPRSNRDYIISLRKSVTPAITGDGARHPVSIHIRYVPDRLICDMGQMNAYFDFLATQPHCGIEELANAIIDDYSNALIPRWICVEISVPVNGIDQQVCVEDRQPLWNNPGLLNRPS